MDEESQDNNPEETFLGGAGEGEKLYEFFMSQCTFSLIVMKPS